MIFTSSLLKAKYFYQILASIRIHCLNTLPVIGIVIMYALLIWTLRKKETQSNEDDGIIGGAADSITESINKKMTLFVKRLVAILLI